MRRLQSNRTSNGASRDPSRGGLGLPSASILGLLLGAAFWQSPAAAQGVSPDGSIVLPTLEVDAPAAPAAPPAPTTPTPALDQPAGETTYTQSSDSYRDKPALTVRDMLDQTPGVTFQGGNGPRDISISVRGSNDHQAFGIRNIQMLEDGFPLIQPDGRGRTDLIDPHAYRSIDAFQGPASTLYGNFAIGGALFLHTRNGADINGVELGSDFGSFGTINNYATIGFAGQNYDFMFFGSNVRGSTATAHTDYDTPTQNARIRVDVTPTDRLIFKFINNNTFTDQSVRLSLNQFNINPYQSGCAALQSAGCGSVSVFRNGAAGATVNISPEQAGLQRDDRRTLGGVRWEHDIDGSTLWTSQFSYDQLDIDQPNTAIAEEGKFDSFDIRSDVTHKGSILNMPLTTYIGGGFAFLDFGDHFHNLNPEGGNSLGPLSQTIYGHQANASLRFQEDLQFAQNWRFVTGLGGEYSNIGATETNFDPTQPGDVVSGIIPANRTFFNLAPEAALIYTPTSDWTLHTRLGTGYGTPQPQSLFVTSQGTFGNNTQLKTQTNIGIDLGAAWEHTPALHLQATGFYEFYRNEQVTESAGAGLQNFTFNAPASEHRGVELAASWHPLMETLPGARIQLSYLYDNQIYTNFTDTLSSPTASASFNRDGKTIPGVVPHFLDARVLYDQDHGPLQGVGGFAELVYRSSFNLDNANELQAPGYAIVNLGLHYDPPANLGLAHGMHIYFEVQNVSNTTYVGSASNITDTLGANGQVGNAATLAAHTGSIFAGNPRTFFGGVRVTF
ncbi:MAG: TonB-dependent receptor [Methylocella sp.]